MKKLRFIIFITATILSAAVYSQDAQEIIKKVQNNYKDLYDAKAEFSMTEKFSGGKSTSSSGTIMIQKENKYKIKTKSYTIVTDGVTSWSYSPSKKQVVIDNYKDDGSTFSPNKFLFNYPENFYSDYIGDEKVNKKDCYILKLTPRNKGNIKSAKIWVDQSEYFIRKITITTSESTKTYTLKSITLNPGLSSSEFKFSPPEGVEIIDLR